MKKSTLRKIGKWVLRLFLLWCFLALLQILIIVVPYPFFPEKLEYKNYILYSDAEIDSSFYQILENVDKRLEAVEINQPELSHRVFLCISEKLYRFYAFVATVGYPGQGFYTPIIDNIFLSDEFNTKVHNVNKGYDEITQYSCLEGNIEEIITHEIVHHLTYEMLGFSAYRSFPFWKMEGYAEYAANVAVVKKDTLYNLHKRIEHLDDESFWGPTFSTPRHYYQSQILIEYLSEVKGLSFNDIVADDIKETEVLKELKEWNK